MIGVPVSYSQLFEGEDKSIDELLANIPSKVVLIVCSYISHHLTIGTSDRKIYEFVSRNWPIQVKHIISQKIRDLSDKSQGSTLTFFNQWCVAEFTKRELLYYRDIEYDKPDTDPLDEYKIFLAYLLSIDESIANQELNLPKEGEDLSKYIHGFEVTWPLLIQQYEFNTEIDPIFESFKSSALLSELKKGKYSSDVDSYVKAYGFDRPYEYLFGYLELMKPSLIKGQKSQIPVVDVPEDNMYRAIVDAKTLDVNKYKTNKKDQIMYSGIRKRPFLHFEDSLFLVLNWSFLYSQVGLGILFDLYFKSSNIRKDYRSVMDFRSEVSKSVTEKVIFGSLLNYAYENQSYTLLHLGESDEEPDAYLRQGKSIFIFEFKDVLFADKSIENGTYEEITKVIEHKFIENEKGHPKGINQLKNHIECISTNSFKFDKFDRKHDRKTVDVFPVIVFGHNQFTMPGINKYLADKMKDLKIEHSFRSIHPLTMISVDYLFKFIEMFRKFRLKQIIKDYHNKVDGHNRDFEKRGKMNSLLLRHGAIEQIGTIYEANGDIRKADRRVLHRLMKDYGVNL
jgi:hypothetical protein